MVDSLAQKKEQAIADIEYELQFKNVLDKNPVFKLGFDADRMYVQREPLTEKENVNVAGIYFTPRASLEEFKEKASNYTSKAGKNIYREIVKAVENKEIPENNFVFLPHNMKPGDRTKFGLNVDQGELGELSGAVSVRDIYDREYEDTNIMHEFMHKALSTNPALIKWKKDNGINHLFEELIMHRMTMKYHPNLADSQHSTVLNSYGVDLRADYNVNMLDKWINDIETISIDELNKQGRPFDDINFFAKDKKEDIYVQTEKLQDPFSIAVTDLPPEEPPQEEEKGTWGSYIMEKLFGLTLMGMYMGGSRKKESTDTEELDAEVKIIPGVPGPTLDNAVQDVEDNTGGDFGEIDAEWFLTKEIIDKLKSETYINLYAKGKEGQDKGFQLPLGYRTNNWLSMHQHGINWDGVSAVKEDKVIFPGHSKESHKIIEVFNTPQFGVRAAMVDTMTKAFKTGGTPEISLQTLIDTNYMEDPKPYLDLAKQKGYKTNTKFNLFDKSQAMEWYTYMLQAEMGEFSNDIPQKEKEKVFNEAYEMAMQRMRSKDYGYHKLALTYLDSSQ